MPDEADQQWGRVKRRCPHCGARAATLGTVCPACGRSYTPGGLLERIPFLNNDPIAPRYSGPLWLVSFAAVIAFVGLVFIRSFTAGTILVAGLFVALVAAIAVTNWMAQR